MAEASARRVLLIDDDEDEFLLAQGLFQQMRSPFALEWEKSYDAGLAAALGGGFDCCLVDYQLGPRTGVELIREAQERGATAPLILLTGHSEGELDVEALRVGAADYVSKQNLQPPVLERSILYALARADALRARGQLRDAESSRESLQQIMGIVGHDLRSPLAAAHAMVSTILRAPDVPEKIRDKLVRVLKSCQRMDRITRDLTDYTQTRIGRGLSVTPRDANIHEVCEQVLQDAASAYPDRAIEYDSDGSPLGTWDPNRLAQAVQNLLLNALKYGDPASPVRLTWHREPPGGTRSELVVSVHNRGEPIPAELLPQVFEPFRRGRAPDGGSSMGLGLFIVRQIALAHGGQISVTSSSEAGTTFTLRLPGVARTRTA